MVRGTLLVSAGDHGLQGQIARLHQVSGRLRWLCGHPALRVQHSNDQGVAAGTKASVQGRDIQQNPITDSRRSHQIDVSEGGYLLVAGVMPRHSELYSSFPPVA